jgi:tripartite-type tricarboxylate transporter receptor subunit TctC
MTLARRQFLRLTGAATLASTLPRIACAQVFPSRPITMVVPFPAGGTTDVIGRIMAERMQVFLGQPVIVENVGGANGRPGVGRVARAPADGYTLSYANMETHVFNAIISALPYDVVTDFEPVSYATSQPYVVAAKNAMPANDLKEFIAWLKANPDKASAGTAGLGSAAHIGGVLFQNATGTRFQFVPYRGGAQLMQDLVAGQIDLIINLAGLSLTQARAGRIKVYAVMGKNRSALAPDIPTVDEAGLPGFYMSSWTGLWAPKGTPKDVIAKLNAAVVDALADPNVSTRLADTGQDIPPRVQQTPEALGALQKAEIEKWWPIIKAAGIKGE